MVERVAQTDHVFVGSLKKLARDEQLEVAAYEVEVIETLKGSATGTLHMFSYTSSAACGFELPDGIYLLGQSELQIKVAKGEAEEPFAGQAGKYGAGLFVLGVHERHDSAERAVDAACHYLAGGNQARCAARTSDCQPRHICRR